MPVGLIGDLRRGDDLAAFVSTHDTYLHSWGSIFVQDVVLPLRKRSLTAPKQHLRTVALVDPAVWRLFIFFFSLLFRQSEHILLFFAITGRDLRRGSRRGHHRGVVLEAAGRPRRRGRR